MSKKLSLIVSVLCFNLLIFLPNELLAWNTSFAGFGTGFYYCTWNVQGGGRPGSCAIQGTFEVTDAALACYNNGGNDPRVGNGHLTTDIIVTTPDTEIISENGHATIVNSFPLTVEEFGLERFADLCMYWSDSGNCDDQDDWQTAFENFYNISVDDCNTTNDTPFAFLIGTVIVNGDVVCDGEIAASATQAICFADTSYNDWPIDPPGPVNYDCNVAPVATNDRYTLRTSNDTDLIVAAPGILDNDNDFEGDTLTATLGTDVSNGTLNLHDDGSFTYTPSAGFTGTDQFSYFAHDANLSSEAWVVITVR